MAQPTNTKSESENGTKPRYETILNSIRKESKKIRESQERLWALHAQLIATNHPAPAQALSEVNITISVALAHAREVFTGF